tara:strand:+ start:2892 stop:3569 length:678 start_codon:yes stop_codon:yes gene_type:complete
MQNRIDSDHISHKLETQGDKVKYLRRLCNLSRKAFFDKYQISESTLRSWELNISPISERLMDKFTAALENEGFSVSASWIRGNGSELPVFITNTQNDPQNIKDKTVEHESNFFLEAGPERIIYAINEDNNAPFFRKGDLVGGEVYDFSGKECFFDHFCLVKILDQEEWQPFLVKKSGDPNLVILLSAQSSKDPLKYPILYDVNLDKIAPIIWHRKVSPLASPQKE